MATDRDRTEPTIVSDSAADSHTAGGEPSGRRRRTVGDELAVLAGSLSGRRKAERAPTSKSPRPPEPASRQSAPEPERAPTPAPRRHPAVGSELGAAPAGRPPDETALGRSDRKKPKRKRAKQTLPDEGDPAAPGRPIPHRRPMPRSRAQSAEEVDAAAADLRQPPRRPLRPAPRHDPRHGRANGPAATETQAGHGPAPDAGRRPWFSRPETLSVASLVACVLMLAIVLFFNIDWAGRTQERLRLEELAEIAETRLQTARQDLADAVERRNAAEETIRGLNEERRGLQSELDRLRDRRADLIGEIAALEAELGTNREAKAQADRIAAQRAEAEAQAAQAEQRARIRQLEEQQAEAIQQARNENAAELRQLRNQLAAARKQAEEARAQAEQAQQSIAQSVGVPQSYGGDLRAFVVDRFVEKVTIVATQARLIIDYAETVALLAREYQGQNLPMPGDALQQYFVSKDTVRQILSSTPTGAQIVESQLQNREFALLPQAEADALRDAIRQFVQNNPQNFNAPLGIRVQSSINQAALAQQLQIAEANYRRMLQSLQNLRNAVRGG